jgi:tRNA(Ile)-lysidine synthase
VVSRHAFDPQWLITRLHDLLPQNAVSRYCVAFSGGLDSTTLLAALASPRPARGTRPRDFELRAVHVDHGLHPDARKWSAHCARTAAALGVPVTIRRIEVGREAGLSLEAQARDARYAALAATLRAGEILLTAQHLDDQLETVLLQLLRGAGIAGLAAMPSTAAFAAGTIARPLLDRPRATLLAWAQSQRLQWIEDSSNADTRIDRNFLRHEVVPLLSRRWPAAASAVARSALHAGEAQALLDDLGRRDIERVADGLALDVRKLRRLEAPRRRNALRYWIARHGVVPPDTRRLHEICGAVLAARRDANPEVRWGDSVLRREQGRLHLLQAQQVTTPMPLLWLPGRRRSLRLPAQQGRLVLKSDPHGPLDLDALPATLRVAWREGNESAALKKILHELRVPASERALLPLLYDAVHPAGRLLAVADRWLHPELRAGTTTRRRARLRWVAPQGGSAV